MNELRHLLTSHPRQVQPPPPIGSSQVPVPSLRGAFLRGIIWSLIGMIYAPLFIGLVELLEASGLEYGAYVAAAAVAGAVGAALYGAREIALIASAVGALVGVLALMLFAAEGVVLQVAWTAAGLAALIALIVRFPTRCSRHVAGKAMAGLGTGAFSGVILTLAEPFHPRPFSAFGMLAFLVSFNGILYVATVRWWLMLSYRLRCESRHCDLIESIVMATLAGLAAGSVWMAIGPLLELPAGLWQVASSGLHERVATAALGGMLGGGVAGMLLEWFRFSWVHDL